MRMFYLYRQPTDPNKNQKAEALGAGVEFGEYGHGQVAIAWAHQYGGGISVYSSLAAAYEATTLHHQGEIVLCWASESAWTPEEARREQEMQAKRLAALYQKMPSFIPPSWEESSHASEPTP